MTLGAALRLLACPHCAAPLEQVTGGVVGCGNGHRFDIARQGYLSLLGRSSRTDTGDSADMVEARMAFLGAGHYQPIASAIAAEVSAGPVLEVGAGTGYYLSVALERLRDNGSRSAVGIALDSSRYAARRAADAGLGSIVADAWSTLPVADAAVPTVLSVFAPRDPAEIARVLAPGGRLIVVTPEPEHLSEIRSTVEILAVDAGKPDRLDLAFDGLLRPVRRIAVHREMRLGRSDVHALVRMGPSARHVGSEQLSLAIGNLAEVTAVTLAVTVSVLSAVRRSTGGS